MRNTWTIFKRESSSYFSQPTAYAIIFIFLLLSLGLAFTFGGFMRLGDANLEWPFFFWHPILFMFLAPAVAMRLWTDEQRDGTIELLATMPVSLWSVISGKFLAAALVWLVALALTFPIVITVNYLGDPDNGAILSGYLGSFLVCASFLAVTMLVSACTRDQVVCLIVSIAVCIFMVLCGYDDLIRALAKLTNESTAELLVSIGVWDHYRGMVRGLFRFQDMVWFASVIITCLLGTSAILAAKRA
jgi:ABC-2 type transport system permease protein